MQICLHHTLTTFSREVTLEKMKITSTQQSSWRCWTDCLTQWMRKNMTRSTQIYTATTQSVVNYFNNNCHGIKKERVRGLKSNHFQNDTTNRVESFSNLNSRSTLKYMIGGLLNCIETLRSERYRQARSLNRIRAAAQLSGCCSQIYGSTKLQVHHKWRQLYM